MREIEVEAREIRLQSPVHQGEASMKEPKSGNAGTKPSAGGAQTRRAMLKWAMLGGGAAVASFFRAPLAQAAATPREQEAQTAVDRATRGMPAPRIKDV